MTITSTGPVTAVTAKTPGFALGSVTSKDGTTIGYRRLGSGPGLVILHGAMESAQSHLQLAGSLADAFTLYLPDRRGRGTSGPFATDHSIQTDVDDVDALLTTTGAHLVFGVSSGALILLHAARSLTAIQKAVIFEPPLLVDPRSVALMRRFDDEIARGQVAAAMVTGMLAARLGPPIFDRIPRFLLERMTQAMLAREEKRAAAGEVTMRALAPTLRYDFRLVQDSQGLIERFAQTHADVLLMRGTTSPAYLRASVDALGSVFPHAERVLLAGLGHAAAGNSDDPMTGRGADPARVARELRRFLS